jgi:hypothetical protein
MKEGGVPRTSRTSFPLPVLKTCFAPALTYSLNPSVFDARSRPGQDFSFKARLRVESQVISKYRMLLILTLDNTTSCD